MIERNILPEEILHKTIIHPENITENPENQGIAIIVVNRKKQILLVKQKEEDVSFGRRAGQWNIITETRERGERVKATVLRALKEELSKSSSEFMVIPGSYRETNGIYVGKMGYNYKYRCIALAFEGDSTSDPKTYFNSTDGEIADYRWVYDNELHKYDIEYGAFLVIDYYRRCLSIL